MVIGNGLLAKAFNHFADNNSVLIFASGVSNSSEQNDAEFEREKLQLLSCIEEKRKLIYFSTISIFDESLKTSKYRIHKRAMEKLIEEKFSSFIIFRLPIVVGKTQNPNTLTNFIFNKINSGEKIKVFSKACRYLMDIDDIANFCTKIILAEKHDNKSLNIHFNNLIHIPDLITLFEAATIKKANTEIVNEGDCVVSDNAEFNLILQQNGFSLPANYNQQLISKYYSTH